MTTHLSASQSASRTPSPSASPSALLAAPSSGALAACVPNPSTAPRQRAGPSGTALLRPRLGATLCLGLALSACTGAYVAPGSESDAGSLASIRVTGWQADPGHALTRKRVSARVVNLSGADGRALAGNQFRSLSDIRVRPGQYEFNVRCDDGNLYADLVLRLTAEAGRRYELHCEPGRGDELRALIEQVE